MKIRNFCLLKSVYRGQEFVITGNNSVAEWAKEIIFKSKKPQNESETNVLLTKSLSVMQKQNTKITLDKSDIYRTSIYECDKLFNFEANNIVSMTCYRKATNEKFEVKFNVEDMKKVKQFSQWKVEKNHLKVYANVGTANTYLHRLIYGGCVGKKVLAKNGNYFDCTRDNLYIKS